MKVPDTPSAREFARLARRRAPLSALVDRVKLWPSRTGTLHGVRSVRCSGGWIEIETHCGEHLRVRDSRTGRGRRQLRHGIYRDVCRACHVPAWKIEKYRRTSSM